MESIVLPSFISRGTMDMRILAVLAVAATLFVAQVRVLVAAVHQLLAGEHEKTNEALRQLEARMATRMELMERRIVDMMPPTPPDHAPERPPRTAAESREEGRRDEPLTPSEVRALRQNQRQQQMVRGSGANDDHAHARALRQTALIPWPVPPEHRYAAAASGADGDEDDEVAAQDLLLMRIRCLDRSLTLQGDSAFAPPCLAPVAPAEENVWIEQPVGLCAEWVRSVQIAPPKHSTSEGSASSASPPEWVGDAVCAQSSCCGPGDDPGRHVITSLYRER